jgi:pyochelin biosynthesis protein PchG
VRRIVVCGTTFGRVHLAALTGPDAPAVLAGVLARGSARSVELAAAAGVPLYRSVDELPADVDAACVAVRAGVVGGPGTDLALALLRRGVHVLAEHPVHRDELARCLRQARESGVHYRLNDHYPHVDAVARFVGAAHALYAYGPPRWVDAATGIQVAFALVDILGRALPAVRPWAFADPAPWPDALARLAREGAPLRSVDGVLGGVPLTLRVHNEVDPRDPDNHAHLLHRITIGTDAGNLTLLNTHGPVVWSPRMHVAGGSRADHTRGGPAVPSAAPIGDACAPSFDHIVRAGWPVAMRSAIAAWLRDVDAGVDPLRRGQRDLTLCEVWQDLTTRIGQPRLVHGRAPVPVGAGDLGGNPPAIG